VATSLVNLPEANNSDVIVVSQFKVVAIKDILITLWIWSTKMTNSQKHSQKVLQKNEYESDIFLPSLVQNLFHLVSMD